MLPSRRPVRSGSRRESPAVARCRAAPQRLQLRVCRGMSQGEAGPMTTGAPLLAIEHLTKRYGNVVALNDVSFGIYDGITGILGENGAGKSTAIRIVLG